MATISKVLSAKIEHPIRWSPYLALKVLTSDGNRIDVMVGEEQKLLDYGDEMVTLTSFDKLSETIIGTLRDGTVIESATNDPIVVKLAREFIEESGRPDFAERDMIAPTA